MQELAFSQLRGLAPDQVLVLVNGKRWHPGAIILTNGVLGRGSQAVDLNTIPIAAIESAGLISYDWKGYGGWGIRRPGERVWAYNMPGDGGQAVRIVWHDAQGQRTTVIGSSHAERIVRAIAAAREALPAGGGRAALPGDEP